MLSVVSTRLAFCAESETKTGGQRTRADGGAGGDWITAAGLPGAQTHRSVLVLPVTRVGLSATARSVFTPFIFAAAAACDVVVSEKRDG